MTIIEQRDLTIKIARETSQMMLMELGMLSKTITRAQVVRTYSRRDYDKSLRYIKWIPKGRNLVADRVEFENYLTRFNIELKEIIK
jgi:hypothetical protein